MLTPPITMTISVKIVLTDEDFQCRTIENPFIIRMDEEFEQDIEVYFDSSKLIAELNTLGSTLKFFSTPNAYWMIDSLGNLIKLKTRGE